MGGEIFLDDTYNSGVEGCPGARMVVDLRLPPLNIEEISSQLEKESSGISDPITERQSSALTDDGNKDLRSELPEELSVLFVDDDAILRKLFCRSVKKVAPQWTIQEASNGETALLLIETQKYDLIFVDQYMASVERQLLGTETVRELRARGVQCRICGFSANDMEAQFLAAGASAFLMKPFPCSQEPLRNELLRILSSSDECKPRPESAVEQGY